MGSPVPANDLPENIVPADDLPDSAASAKPPASKEAASSSFPIDRGSFQAAGSILSSLIAPLGGGLTYLGTLAATRDPQAAEAVRQATEERLTYQPTEKSAQESLQKIGNVVRPVSAFLGRKANEIGEGTAEQTGSPLLGALERTGLAAIPLVMGGGAALEEGGLERAATSATDRLASNASKLEQRAAQVGEGGAAAAPAAQSPSIMQAARIGLKLTPEQVNSGLVGRAAQSLSGSAKLERAVSKENIGTVNDIGAKDIGLTAEGRAPGAPITDADIAKAKAPHLETYNDAAQAGDVALKPEDFSGVTVRGTLKNQQVEDLLDHYRNMPQIDAQDLMTDMAQLRADASKNIKAPFAPAQNQLGFAQRKVSDALEGALGRRLESMDNPPVSLQDFRNARQSLAKIHSVSDALDDAGNVSASALSKQLDHGVPLSGDLRAVAESYGTYPRALQDASKIRDSGPFSVLDPLFGSGVGGGIGALAGHVAGGGAGLAAVLARPAIRSILASGPYQRTFIHTATGPVAGGLSPAYRAMLESARARAAEELALGAIARRTAHAAHTAHDISGEQETQ